jgi:predicted MFS family arabinose efflux permease
LTAAAPSALAQEHALPSRRYAWLVFALSFGLLLSDYMSRQVLNAVFPLLKAEWTLSDTALGSLTGVVALMVGLLTFPLSLAADKFGKVASVALMALLWSAATLACGLAANFEQMLGARLMVGVGEAAYGSVALAIAFGVFPASMRSTITGSFMAGGVFGSFAGVALGGVIAEQFGWRTAFFAMAIVGIALGALYALLVRERRIAPNLSAAATAQRVNILRQVFGNPMATLTYIASGLQLFVVGAMTGWLPSFFNRAYEMAPARAAAVGGGFLLISGVGMILCGVFADRISRGLSSRRLIIASVYCLITFASLVSAFSLPPGPLQLALAGVGLFFAAGSSGPAGAIVAHGADPRVLATVLATLTLANNLLGLAPGPIVTGILADHTSLSAAFQVVPFIGFVAALMFLLARRLGARLTALIQRRGDASSDQV